MQLALVKAKLVILASIAKQWAQHFAADSALSLKQIYFVSLLYVCLAS